MVDAAVAGEKTAYFSYLLAKKALQDLTRMSARSLAPDILVNAVAPGFILPPEEKGVTQETRVQQIPLKRQGRLENITQTVEFLLTTDFVTGQTLFVDGGEHLL